MVLIEHSHSQLLHWGRRRQRPTLMEHPEGPVLCERRGREKGESGERLDKLIL